MAMDAADVLSAQDDTAENYETVAEDTVGEFVSEEADTDSEETDPESTEPSGELENGGEEISAEDLTISGASQDTEEELEIQEENNLNEDDELSMDEAMEDQKDSDFDSGEEVKEAGAGTITEEGTSVVAFFSSNVASV